MAALDDAINQISEDIAETGALTREASRRYDEMFENFRRELDHALDLAPTMADAALAAMSITQTASTAIRENFPNQTPLGCREGCSACCHLFVSVPPGVTALIADHIRKTFSSADLTALQQRLQSAAQEIEQATTTSEVRARCPLLDANDKCSIYDIRPLSCRAFTSTDAGCCNAMVFGAPEQQQTEIPQDPGHYRLHIEATDALQQLAAKRERDPRQKGFVHALLDRLATA
jgi:Fe-S-cluster containining protein